MSHFVKIVTLFSIILLLAIPKNLFPSSIREESVPKTSIPKELRQIVDENRNIALPQPHLDIYDIMSGYRLHIDEEEDIRIAEILKLRLGQNVKGWKIPFIIGNTKNNTVEDPLDILLTCKQMEEDICFLFELLRYGYGSYQYIGGDNVFIPRKDSALKKLTDMCDPLHVSSFFMNIIDPSLTGLIKDYHFCLTNLSYVPWSHVPYMSSDFILRNYEGSFFIEIDNVLYRILEITQDSIPINGILPTLTQEGEFAWVFGLIAEDRRQKVIEISILFENIITGEIHSKSVNLSNVAIPVQRDTPMISIRENNGVTIMENKTMYARSHEESTSFFHSATELRGKPVLIIDLRGNGGGQGGYPRHWFRLFTGYEPVGAMIFNYPNSKVSEALLGFDHTVESQTELNSPIENFSEEWEFPPQIIPNDNLVIVLMDKNTASAAELFAGNLRRLENVLFVGTNTKGALVSGNIGKTNLPHSNLEISFGTTLALRPDLSPFEGIGFMPDLYVPTGESLERVLKFIERYGLAK